MMNLSTFLSKCWHAVVPYYMRKRLYYYKSLGGNRYHKDLQEKAIEIGKKERIKVLFIVVNLPMWRGQGVYDLLLKDKRFDPRIIITPLSRYTQEEAMRQYKMLVDYFSSHGMKTPASVIEDGFNLDKWLMDFDPDIIFPCQQYDIIYNNKLDIIWNMDKIMAYIPYGIPTMRDQFVYNTTFHNLAWKVYHATPLHLKTARRLMANNAENVRIVGEIDYDKYSDSCFDPWKKINDGKRRKRIIWAPHFSIDEANLLHRASFLWMYKEMLELIKKYEDKSQFVFKPHPHLFNTLVKRPDWGREKAEEYYNIWATSYNTQLWEGDFIDLFKTSDAMIHDCGSFTGEYMMTGNPVMFMTKDAESIRANADDFGAGCLELHYYGNSIHDVEAFINDTVIKGSDVKTEDRAKFRDLMFEQPRENRTTAERIYSDLLEGLGLYK